MFDTIKTGDTIYWRGGFGRDPVKPARVEALTVTAQPREKYGTNVDEVHVSLVRQNRVVFSLNTGNWAYSEQIDLSRGLIRQD